jgi:hypothetical protein
MARTGDKTRRSTWVRSLLRRGDEPILEELEWCSESEWQTRERFWIAHARDSGHDLVNGTDGGDEPPPGFGTPKGSKESPLRYTMRMIAMGVRMAERRGDKDAADRIRAKQQAAIDAVKRLEKRIGKQAARDHMNARLGARHR